MFAKPEAVYIRPAPAYRRYVLSIAYQERLRDWPCEALATRTDVRVPILGIPHREQVPNPVDQAALRLRSGQVGQEDEP